MRRLTFCVTAICVIWACYIASAQDRGWPSSIAWSPDGKAIAVGSSLGVWFFDSQFNEEGFIDLPQHTDPAFYLPPISLEWNGAGNLIAVGYPMSGNDGGDIQVIDVDKLEVITRIYLRDWEEWLWSEVVWHPTDNLVAAGGYWHKAFVWNALTGEMVFEFEESDEQIAFSWNSTLAVCWLTETIIAIVTQFETYVVDIERNKTLQSFDIRTVVEQVDCASDYRIYAGLREIVDLETGASVEIVRHGINPADRMFWHATGEWPTVHDLKFSPDGTKILRIEDGCLIHLFHGHTGSLLADIPGGIYIMRIGPLAVFRDSLAWHPDGSLFAAVGQFGGVSVWDAESYELLRRFDGFESSYPEMSGLYFDGRNEEELKLIDAFKTRCIEALKSEPRER